MVLRELVTAWRLAASPTTRSPLLVNATTDGVVRLPSEFSRTSGSPPSITALQEFVVPQSISNTFAIKTFFFIKILSTLPARTVPDGHFIHKVLFLNNLRLNKDC